MIEQPPEEPQENLVEDSDRKSDHSPEEVKSAGELPPDPAADAPEPAVNHEAETLEELTLPSSVEGLAPLADGTSLGASGQLTLLGLLERRGRVNRYRAYWRAAESSVVAEVREAPRDHDRSLREADVLRSVRHGMLPTLLDTFEHNGRRYTVVEPIEGTSLDSALAEGVAPEAAMALVLQLAQALRRLHRGGWAHVSFTPSDVVLGEPLKLVQLGGALRLGETPPAAMQIAGYSAPELAQPTPITGKEDVYTLGAILFRALTGELLPESGAETTALPSLVRIPGVPQLLMQALTSAAERADLETWYQQLLLLRQRLGQEALALEVASATSVGLNPTRLTNEDSCGYATWSVSTAEGMISRTLLVVADGMGGMEAGEVASGTALRTIMREAAVALTHVGQDSAAPPLDPVALIRAAAPAVHAAGQGRQMGTTATVAVVQGSELTLAHVGDTRAYLMREGTLTQLTTDHSLVAAMVTSGVLTKEEARGHPDSNKVLRSLGSQRELPNDYVDDLSAAYDHETLPLRVGDWLLLCSDGVWGSVPDERIQEVLSEALDCPTAAGVLVTAALHAGAPDNAAAVVARCVAVPWH